MYRRMGPKELEKIIEEVKEWKKNEGLKLLKKDILEEVNLEQKSL